MKLKRRETYERTQLRLSRLATRRDHSPKDVKKQAFRGWYDKERIYHDLLLRCAKKENKPWRVRVAVMVERLPIVTPDMPQWEREFIDLTDYLATFGKEYPEETGFMYAMDKPEDHVVPTDEELLGKWMKFILPALSIAWVCVILLTTTFIIIRHQYICICSWTTIHPRPP